MPPPAGSSAGFSGVALGPLPSAWPSTHPGDRGGAVETTGRPGKAPPPARPQGAAHGAPVGIPEEGCGHRAGFSVLGGEGALGRAGGLGVHSSPVPFCTHRCGPPAPACPGPAPAPGGSASLLWREPVR